MNCIDSLLKFLSCTLYGHQAFDASQSPAWSFVISTRSFLSVRNPPFPDWSPSCCGQWTGTCWLLRFGWSQTMLARLDPLDNLWKSRWQVPGSFSDCRCKWRFFKNPTIKVLLEWLHLFVQITWRVVHKDVSLKRSVYIFAWMHTFWHCAMLENCRNAADLGYTNCNCLKCIFSKIWTFLNLLVS